MDQINVKLEKSTRYNFLYGGGELGQLIRDFDWSETPVGPIDEWPASLRTTVGIILHTDFPMFLWWGDDMIQFYNDAYRPSLGQEGKHPKALGQKAIECWPEIWDIISPLILQVRTTGKSFFSEDQLVPIYRNGKIEDVYWTFSYSAVIGESGTTDGVLVVCHETTKKVQMVQEIKNKQKQIELSEANLRRTILKAPVAMCILKGPDFKVEIANSRMIEIWGKPEEAILDRPIFVGLPEAKHQGFEELLHKVFTTGETHTAYGVPVMLPRRNRIEKVYINYVYAPMRGEGNKIIGIIAVANEVTELVTAREKIEDLVAERTEELNEANLKLQKSNNELSQFAYITSHDLQEPARKVSLYVEMLDAAIDKGNTHVYKTYIKKIDKSARRMLNLIKDILSFSQLGKGADDGLESLDLNEIVYEVRKDLDFIIEEKNARIEIDPLPTIRAKRIEMIQLFANLLSNGLKYSSNERTPEIKILATSLSPHDVSEHGLPTYETNWFKISVSDNGIGFEEKDAKMIFEIFKRLHSGDKIEGTGIGLAICKKIVAQHNGKIFATGVPGRGATFNIILPEHPYL